MLKCYVDAGTHQGSGLLTVAGYLFESGSVRRFKQEWSDTFGSNNFSWADLIARSKHFRPLAENRAEHDRLVAAGVSLVRKYVIGGTVTSCWIQDVERFGPTFVRGFGHAYSVAGHMAIAGMGTWVKDNNYRGGIAYVIEEGDDGYDQLDHLLSYARKSLSVRDLYQWSDHWTAPKMPGAPFHAPDLLAWEWCKYWRESVADKKRPIRMSLIKLLVGRLDRYKFQHLGGEPLLKFFNRIHALGVEQLQEDRAAASVQPIDLRAALEFSGPTERVGNPQ